MPLACVGLRRRSEVIDAYGGITLQGDAASGEFDRWIQLARRDSQPDAGNLAVAARPRVGCSTPCSEATSGIERIVPRASGTIFASAKSDVLGE